MSIKFDLYLYQRLKPQNSDGFTLLEILVVLGIVGILIAIAAPSLLAMQGAVNVNNSLEKVRSTLELSQIEAIKKKSQYGCRVFIIKDNNDRYTRLTSTCLIGFEAVDETGKPIVQLDRGVEMTILPKPPNTDWIKTTIKVKNPTTGNMEDSQTGDGEVVYNSQGLTQNEGIIVVSSDDNKMTKKCLVINAGIGLLRQGTYIDEPSGVVPTCQMSE